MKKVYIVQEGEHIIDDYGEHYIENLEQNLKAFLNFKNAVDYCKSIFKRNLNYDYVKNNPVLKQKIESINNILYTDLTEGADYNGDCYFVGEQNEDGNYLLTYVNKNVTKPNLLEVKDSAERWYSHIFIIFEIFLEE